MSSRALRMKFTTLTVRGEFSEECFGVGVRWTDGDSGGVRLLTGFPRGTSRRGSQGGEVADDRHGMGDEEVGEAEVALELCEQVDDLSADARYVECGDRLVADNEFFRISLAPASPMRWR